MVFLGGWGADAYAGDLGIIAASSDLSDLSDLSDKAWLEPTHWWNW